MYKLGARLRGAYGETLSRIDPADLGIDTGEEATVLFTHPLCTDCHVVERQLRESGDRLVTVDVREHRDLARRYGISVVPALLSIGPDGAGGPKATT